MQDSRQVLLRYLVERRTISDADISSAHARASEGQAGLIEMLIEAGNLDHRDLALARARVSGAPYVDLARYTVDLTNASLLPQAVAERFTAFPVFVVDGVASVAMIDPLDLTAIEAIRLATHHEIEPVVCDEEAIRNLISTAYQATESTDSNSKQSDATQSAGPAALHTTLETAPSLSAERSLSESTLLEAFSSGADGIHIYADDPEAPVRFRARGGLTVQPCAHTDPEARLLAQQIKAFAGLETTRVRTPQRGTLKVECGGKLIEGDVSVLPTVSGEDLFVRIRRGPAATLRLADLSMPEKVEAFCRSAATQSRGLVLFTGPAESGRSTTVAALLRDRSTSDVYALCTESHTDYGIPGVRQIQIDPAAGYSESEIIYLASRQQPDVLVVGELVNADAAHAAVNAATRGTLVIATMETPSVEGAIGRLNHFGIAPDLMASTLVGIVNQRLVHQQCTSCLVIDHDAHAQLASVGYAPDPSVIFKRGSGCEHCSGTGQSESQVALFDAWQSGTGADVWHGSIFTAAIEKAESGEISVSEACRAITLPGSDMSTTTKASTRKSA